MLKGCERRIIYIRDTGSPLFKEAYFILRDSAPAVRKSDMVAEATRIIRERSISVPYEKKSKKTFRRRTFAFGFAAGIALFACGLLITLLIL